MNIAKHMEAIFIIAGLVSVTTLATASVGVQRFDPPALVQVAGDSNMAVVTIVGKRLSAAEKAQLAD